MLNLSVYGTESGMDLDDLMCPICRKILIEPVTLPCRHSLCLKCLQIIIEQRSLSCPLCNIRVSSWLRTATKSQTLVNNHLWHSIQSTFSKQLQDYSTSSINKDFFIPNKVHKPENIQRDYSKQMQPKIKQKQVINMIEKDNKPVNNGMIDRYLIWERDNNLNDSVKKDLINNFYLDKYKNKSETLIVDNSLKSNKNLLSGLEQDNNNNGDDKKDEKSLQLSKPSCSYSINEYNNRVKKRNNPKVTVKSRGKKDEMIKVNPSSEDENNDKRIDSAQSTASTASHDSINPEIHHFKPIKIIPRTPLKLSQDGKQFDPKLIRVMPILKRISNPVLKPPTSVHFKRIIGSTWSAFKEYIGQIERNIKTHKSEGVDVKSEKGKDCQLPETARKIELISESFDNKNYPTKFNQLINGIKISQKLFLDETDAYKLSKSQVNEKNVEEKTKNNLEVKNINDNLNNKNVNDELSVVENIAERIKRRKINLELSKKNNFDDKSRVSNGKRSADEDVNKTSPVKKVKVTKTKLKVDYSTNKRSKTKKNPTKSNVDDCQNNQSVIDKNSCEENRLLIQEREDFEFAQRLQAEFNEMERISSRTRRSHRTEQFNNINDKTVKNKVQSKSVPRKKYVKNTAVAIK